MAEQPNRLYIVFSNEMGEAVPVEAASPEAAKQRAAITMKCEPGPLRVIDATDSLPLQRLIVEVAERARKRH
jgi:hypothetical protein